jgi:hypothetical protein
MSSAMQTEVLPCNVYPFSLIESKLEQVALQCQDSCKTKKISMASKCSPFLVDIEKGDCLMELQRCAAGH